MDENNPNNPDIVDNGATQDMDNASSLSLSITPPLLDNNELQERPSTPPSVEHSISEHLSTNSASTSVENDRSLHEIEISNQFTNNILQNIHNNADIINISQENKPASLNTSIRSDSSVVSLNYLNQFGTSNGNFHVQSILEEILNNEQFLSGKQDVVDNKTMQDDSLIDIFANIDLDDKSLNNKDNSLKKIRDFEEIIAIKDNTIAALNNELDSFREMSNSMSTTEYKQLQDELHSKLMEYNSMIVYKDDLIQQLSESLEQSVMERKELLTQIERFKEEITQLEVELKSTSKMLNERVSNKHFVDDKELEELKKQKDNYKLEIKHLNDLLTTIKSDSNNFNEMKNELEAKHAKEMEELRRYFEKKCADLEKNYSEEVFSQQSRKMSGSSLSSCSEIDLKSGEFVDGQFSTKNDIELLRSELNTILSNINSYNLDNNDDLHKCEQDLMNINLNFLQKINKQQLLTEFEMKIKELNELHDNKMKLMEEEMESLKNQLKQIALPSSIPIQEVASSSSGEFEITEVVQSYERRLQEQISLAKIDIINALENQIQRLVANETDEEEEWPLELLQLRDRFANKYEKLIEDLNRNHEDEINKLKEEHLKLLNNSLGRAKRKSEEKLDVDIIKERDLYKKQTTTLRNLLGDLLKYFTQCEDELNSTLVDELLPSANLTNDSIKRVHLTPNVNELMQLIDANSSFDDSDSNNLSIELKNELGTCLEKLKNDANAILTLTTNLNQQPTDDLTKKLLTETELKEKLMQEMRSSISVIQTLENEKDELENRFEEVLQRANMLETELDEAKQKIGELIENGHKEVVSEGYGAVGQTAHLGDTMKALSNLQDTARVMVAQSRLHADPNLLHIIEELCNLGEKIKEESQKEIRDLWQQIEAADKKYKTTHEFLEEQANERELERDEAQKKILQLNELLKERDKEKVSREMMSSEVDALEHQLQQTTKLLNEHQDKIKLIESERNEAIDKIKVLRDIIRELEHQNDVNVKENEEFHETVNQLQCIIKQQHTIIDELKQNPFSDNISDVNEMRKHINKLENELQQLRLTNELAGSEGVIKQLQLQLCEIEVSLDKKTRDLEQLHQTSTNCSTPPSEDMSIRDVIRPQSPTNTNLDECEVPLQQLERLKEKLVRHSRAEEAAIKRTRDMEMQIYNLKSELDENLNEKECLKKQLQEHLVLISDLQIRLDEQRIRAEHIEKQANTSLETKMYDLKIEIIGLQERIKQKDKQINQLNGIINETQKRVKDLEDDLNHQPTEDEIIVEMQKELHKLRMENKQLNEKLMKDSQLVPNLVENIITDKNLDIEKLQKKLNDTEMLLKQYYTLNLTQNELDVLLDLKKSNTSINDVLNEVEQVRRLQSYNESCNLMLDENAKQQQTQFLTQELSSIDHCGPEHINYTTQGPLVKPNSTELYKSSEKHVHFEDDEMDLLKKRINELENELKDKELLINDLTDRLKQLNEVQDKIQSLQIALEETELTLKDTTKTFENEQQNLKLELVESNVLIVEQSKKIEMLEEDSRRKDEMCLKLTKEKKELERKLENKDDANKFSTDLEMAKSEYQSLKKKLNKKREQLHHLEQSQSKQEVIIKQLKEQNNLLTDAIKDRECEIEILNEDAKRYQNDLNDFEMKLEVLKTEKMNCDKNKNDSMKEINHLNELIKEKDKIIQQITEDSHKLHENLIVIKSKLNETGNIVDLANKLREEQKKNTDLIDEIQNLKIQLLQLQQQQKMNIMSESVVDEITGQLQRELDYSVQIDTNILNAINDQDPKSLLEKCQQLQQQLKEMENFYTIKINELKSQLEYERFILQQTQIQDAELIEQLRLKLDSLMDKQQMDEKKVMSDSSPTEYREPPTKELLELNQLKYENEKLLKAMKLMKQQKQEIENNAKYGKKLLSMEVERCKSLGEKVEELLSTQKELRELLLTHKLQLEEKIHEIENNKILLNKKEQEKNYFIKENQHLIELTKRNNPPEDDNHELIARSDYLFAKNMRLESIKKALIWQKRYLMSYLMTHREHCLIQALPHTKIESKRLKLTPINRFRSTVFVVISIIRMKYLVIRWTSGARIAQNVNGRHYRYIKGRKSTIGTASSSSFANFQIGQPVSQQNFVQNHWNPFHQSNMLGDGQPQQKSLINASSPPTKDTHVLSLHTDPLKAPTLLAQFADRFDQIQEKLGIVLENDNIS